MRGRALLLVMVLLAPLAAGTVQAQWPEVVAEEAWPGEPIDNHVHMTWAALTLEVNGWADDHPDIVDLMDIGDSELGKTLWVVRLSDWSMDTKPNGSAKEIVYIDGGHHGNEYLGTALAYLTAKFYINEWEAGNQEAIDVLQNTELHILIMLNPDGNDIDTRWNINQVDLNRNYDHYWNTCPTTQPGSSAFSESETMHNSDYMNAYVTDADLYVTMHTGVWIMLYPWGKWADQPPDWELFWGIREDVHATVSDIPIQNANQGLYPNCGTSRDYGYGVMGFPTFTFETDDEQFVPGSFESLHSRLAEELDVMRFLINNVWYWRARLDVASLEVSEDSVSLDVTNHGYASTTNASLEYRLEDGSVAWASSLFNVNASTSKTVDLAFETSLLRPGGSWNLNYQKRVIDASTWVNESVPAEAVDESGAAGGESMPIATAPLLVVSLLAAIVAERRKGRDEDATED
ncbi:MAG: M14 family metallopeptidase [Candidatus Poseidoniaceae archaeon]